jgi:hypothetical protein
MKRLLLVIVWGLLMSLHLYAGGRFILVEYKHARRVPYNEISIEIGSENNSDKIFFAKLLTKDMGQKDENTPGAREISIEKEYFDSMYSRILDLDFKEILKSYENRISVDGFRISITAGTFQNSVKISLINPYSSSLEAEKFCMIVLELFTLFDMEKWIDGF